MDKERAADFLEKAEKLLKWCEEYRVEMQRHGQAADVERVERTFVAILLLFDTAHQALADAAKKLDMEAWRDTLNQLREQDSLLRYLWKARNSEAHDALVKWRPSMKHVNIRIVDAVRAERVSKSTMGDQRQATSRLFCYIYGVKSEQELMLALKDNPMPSDEALREAGVELVHSLDSLALDDFTIGRGRGAEKILAPSSHLGTLIPPSADEAVSHGIVFYRNKLVELKESSAHASSSEGL